MGSWQSLHCANRASSVHSYLTNCARVEPDAAAASTIQSFNWRCAFPSQHGGECIGEQVVRYLGVTQLKFNKMGVREWSKGRRRNNKVQVSDDNN